LISRVILLNVLLLILGVGTFAMYHLQREQTHLIDVNRQNAQLLLNTIERSIFHSMCSGNQANVQVIMEKVASSSEIESVQIFDPDGTILRSGRPDELGKQVEPRNLELFKSGEIEGFYETPDGTRYVSVLQPIKADGRCVTCHDDEQDVIGVLALDFSLSHMYGQLGKTSKTFIISTLVNLVALTVGIALIMTRLLRNPLRQITEGMGQVEAGDLTVRMPERANDEVGQLMHGFNSMVTNLEQAQNELKQFHYQQMERAERLASVGEMAAGLAHEIKNPLAGIGGAIDVLADDYDAEDPRREVMSQIQKQVNRLNKTVTDLLYFGRPGEPEFTYVDINALIKQTQLFASQHPEAKNIN
jgi:methyl-accepting chemotaxis protein